MARTHVLIAAVLFGTTGTAQALGPDIEPLAVGSARIVVGAALLAVVTLAAARAGAGGGRGARALLGTGDRRLIFHEGALVAVSQASCAAARPPANTHETTPGSDHPKLAPAHQSSDRTAYC